MGLLWVGMTAIMLGISYFRPRPEPYVMRLDQHAVDLTPWKYGPRFATFLMAMLVFVYLICSPIGFAGTHGMGWPFAISNSVLILVALGVIRCLSIRAARNDSP